MNITAAFNYTMRLEAVMYPYNGESAYPCLDSSPRSAAAPATLFCAGQEIRYNEGFVDPNADSLRFSLTNALHSGGVVPYSGYTGAQPLPGPNLDPSYPLVSLNPATGQMDYDLPGGIQGRWVIVTTAEAYRCGQLISRNSSDMLLMVLPSTEQNEIPAIATPQWTAPETASGFEVTVNAGDLVSFVLEGVDTDMIGGLPQMVGFTASGTQFGAYFTDPDSGCTNLPCATLSGTMPGETGEGAVSTTFNWQTDCAHVMGDDVCLPQGSTYHFHFRYHDDYCPAPGNNLVTVAVTVLPDPVVESPTPRCVEVTEDGEVNIEWTTVEDTFTPPAFAAYSVYHATSPSGPFQEIGTLTDINAGSFSHTADNPVTAPSFGGQNHYQIRTRSGCNGAALYPQTATVATMRLTVEVQGSVAMLAWTPVSSPALPGTSPEFRVMRKLDGQQWESIATVAGFTFSDMTVNQNGPVLYRVEQDNDLPCVSMSAVVEGYFNVGIDRLGTASHIVVIPNPSDGRITVRSESGAGMSGYVLTDLSGKVLLQDSFTNAREDLNLNTELSPGIYLLRVETKGGLAISRLVIH